MSVPGGFPPGGSLFHRGGAQSPYRGRGLGLPPGESQFPSGGSRGSWFSPQGNSVSFLYIWAGNFSYFVYLTTISIITNLGL